MPEKCKVRFLPGEAGVEVPPGTTIMAAAIRAGVFINGVCGGDGVCGRCRVIVRQGKADDGSTQFFTREEIQAGYILACEGRIESDLVVDVPPETRLPATRDLAASLGLSRITVTNAYAELEAEGFVYTQRGSGTFVAPPLPDLPPGEGEPSAAVEWPLWQQRLLSQTWLPVHGGLDRLMASVTRPDAIRFSSGMGAHDLFPLDE